MNIATKWPSSTNEVQKQSDAQAIGEDRAAFLKRHCTNVQSRMEDEDTMPSPGMTIQSDWPRVGYPADQWKLECEEGMTPETLMDAMEDAIEARWEEYPPG